MAGLDDIKKMLFPKLDDILKRASDSKKQKTGPKADDGDFEPSMSFGGRGDADDGRLEREKREKEEKERLEKQQDQLIQPIHTAESLRLLAEAAKERKEREKEKGAPSPFVDLSSILDSPAMREKRISPPQTPPVIRGSDIELER
jgi:hypothetical protein